MTEQEIEQAFIEKLRDLKYTYRQDIRDRAALEKNFREKFEALNRVAPTDAEFARLRDEIINARKPKVKRSGAAAQQPFCQRSQHKELLADNKSHPKVSEL